MNVDNTKKLYDDFPELYVQHEMTIQESCMPWGFECGNGWFDLIYKLSADLSKLDIVPEASQVKEKFGSLRFYLSFGSDEAYKLIDEAEGVSAKTCVVCGKDGKDRNTGWIRPLCEDCKDD